MIGGCPQLSTKAIKHFAYYGLSIRFFVKLWWVMIRVKPFPCEVHTFFLCLIGF